MFLGYFNVLSLVLGHISIVKWSHIFILVIESNIFNPPKYFDTKINLLKEYGKNVFLASKNMQFNI